MILAIAVPVLLLSVVILGLLLGSLQRANRAEAEAHLREIADLHAAHLDATLREIAAIAATSARAIERTPTLDEDALRALLRENVEGNARVFGAALAFEPEVVPGRSRPWAPYVARAGDELRELDIERDVLDWYGEPRWTWWHDPKETGAAAWTAPYFDEGAGDVMMVTFSAPIRRDGAFAGVATVDVALPTLREIVGLPEDGDAEVSILERDGRFVLARTQEIVHSRRTVFEVAESVGRADVAEGMRRLLAGDREPFLAEAWAGEPPPGLERWSERRYLVGSRVPSTGWTLIGAVSERAELAGAHARLLQAAIALAILLVLVVVAIVLVSGRFTRPIRDLAATVGRIATGDLEARCEVRRHDEIGALASDVNAMAGELASYTERLAQARARSREGIIFALAKLAESRDDDTGKHLERIGRYVDVLGDALVARDQSYDADWVRTVRATSALHDIGKVAIPDAVLKKPGRLTDEERAVMQSHATLGGETIRAVEERFPDDAFMRMAMEIALGHHEKWDGSGYPAGRSGEEIALAARIVALADVYDALTSKRVYKDAMPHEKARAIIVEGSGSHFDPGVVELFLEREDAFRAIAAELG